MADRLVGSSQVVATKLLTAVESGRAPRGSLRAEKIRARLASSPYSQGARECVPIWKFGRKFVVADIKVVTPRDHDAAPVEGVISGNHTRK